MRIISIYFAAVFFFANGLAVRIASGADALSENFKTQVMTYLRDSGKLAVLQQSLDLEIDDFRKSINESRASSELLLEIWPKDFDLSIKRKLERIDKLNKMALYLWEKNVDIVEKLTPVSSDFPQDFTPTFHFLIGDKLWDECRELLGNDLISPTYRGLDPKGDFRGKQYISYRNVALLLKRSSEEFREVRKSFVEVVK